MSNLVVVHPIENQEVIGAADREDPLSILAPQDGVRIMG